ncbi:DUF2314 domain-containing protein [Chitinophaga flava]|uniref:DUF2314 domain-containing protein n=1 Tax=Chitinophaga flava TaxID=2259036 RepID=A0A365XXJ8_9BACT|nr:DUF2314 domain-containing protein [Chitinophaga flava]RBL90950.1 hypothetical protein DF182_23590 [Chitinophaga flava]
MEEKHIFYSEGDDPAMLGAFKKAQETFKYCWRELSWESRRIVPALDFACVKIAFSEETGTPGKPIVEYMWVNEISFDGETVRGVLINEPDRLQNVKNGDYVEAPLSRICDWLLATEGKSYGGFTVQLLRSGMSPEERQQHDEAWDLDFGDYNDIQLVRGQKEHPGNLTEHPMSVNMKDSFISFLQQHPSEITQQDDAGYTLLHKETIAGNKTIVEVLLEAGADKNAKTLDGKTALDFARQLNWEHIIPLLSH